ncbi:MAG TPA: AAA family ATPase [Archangium sp.]|uniref:AAA family ATPase n=1 Tax=Archangium sp. TaxID=1872627 RepID=UPI002E31CE55|nr:AAA family ATPase [Archangium sp.]HEX5746501.1 AAA family ATPase [Archangium sp.]
MKPLTLRKNFQPMRDALPTFVHLGASASALWVHHQQQLQDVARRFAESKQLTVAQPDAKALHGLKGWPADWEPGQLQSLAAELASQHEFASLGEIAVDAARLMLFMLCIKAPTAMSSDASTVSSATEQKPEAVPVAVPEAVAVEPSSGPVAPLSPREHFERLLAMLRALPDAAPEWEDLDGFLRVCGELAHQRKERQASRHRLLDSLARLAEPEVAKGLAFLSHLTGHEHWSASVPAKPALDSVVGELGQLLKLLAEVSAHLKLPPPRNIQENRERTRRLDELSTESERLHQLLSRRLLPANAPPVTGAAGDEGGGTGAASPVPEASASEPDPEPVAVTASAPVLPTPGVMPASDVPTPAMEPPRHGADVPVREAAPVPARVAAASALSSRPEPAPAPVETPTARRAEVVVLRPASPPKAHPAPIQEPSLPATPEEPELRTSKKLSRRDAAEVLLAHPSAEARATFLFALVTEGDVAGAYWLSRAIEAKDEKAPVPSWLLAALAGSTRLQGDSIALTSGLTAIASEHEWPAAPHLQLLALASALPSIIRAPGSGLLSWLAAPDDLASLRELVEPLREFALHGGLALPADSQLMLKSHAERSERIRATVEEVRRWHERVGDLRTSYLPARNVLGYLLRTGDLLELLDAAKRDDRSQLEEVARKLALWRDSSHVNAMVDEVRRREQIKERIVGSALAWIQSRVEELCERVATWFELVQLDERLTRNYDWVMRQLDELRQKLGMAFPKALRAMDAYEREEDFAQVAAGCAALRRAILQLADMLSCRLDLSIQSIQLPADVLLRERLIDLEGGLDGLLARRLMTLPSVRLPLDKERWSDGLGDLFTALPREILSEPGVEGSIEAWLTRRDFRFIPHLLPLVESSERRKEFEDRTRLEQEEARRQLKRRIERIRAEVEQAVVDGFIGDERSGLTGRLDGIVVDTTREMEGSQHILDAVAGELAGARHRGLEIQRERWNQLRPRMAETGWADEQRDLAARRIEEVLTAGDYRSADELLARLEDSVDNHREFDVALFAAPKHETRHLEDFIHVLPRLEQELQTVRGREVPKRVQEVLLGGSERAEGHRDLRHVHDAWSALVNARARQERVPEMLAALLGQLGFQLEGEPGESFERLKDDPHLLFQVRASSRRLSPVPHFGSRVEGRLRVMCLWVPQGREILTGALQQLRSESEGTLIFYLDRLGLARRRQLCSLSRQYGAAAIVIDEWMLLYLSALHEGDARLRALFDCTLPFSSINPYVQRAGTVPPEMFFGRDEMARRLSSFDGTSLVYGGRQLGKSALLEQVERRFTEADPTHHFAIRLDIKDVGDPAASQAPEHLWPRIRDELKRKRFFSAQVSTDKPDDLVRRIGEVLGGDKGRKLLILLDEADNFLDADAKKGFEQVKRLRELMSRHPGLCKVVLAGLHNVQRFQGIANQPLAHFGSALLVGPLDARDANELVRRPLEALGYRLPPEEKNGSILRILSYTNYHPGLIQLFCRDLVDMLQRRADPQMQPPYFLREADVEDVYRKQETRQLIRERFEWTLALDARYQAIVWSLIVFQEDGRDGFSQSFSTSAILSLVQGFWPQGFEEVESDQMQGLLEEMVGLGVLVRNAQDEYRLRSPNVVRLLGSIRDIWVRLGELANKPAPVAFDADHHHVRLGGDPPRFSPLTYAQERLLTEQRSSVALLLGSRATQLEDLVETLRRTLVSSERPEQGAFLRVPEHLHTPRELQEWLKDSFRDRDEERVLFLRELSVAEAGEGRWVDAAQDFCEGQRSKKRWARVVFVLRPAAAWAWMTRAVPGVSKREQVLTMPLKRWTRPALIRLFEEVDIRTADEEFRKRVLEVTTGGWPYLLNRFVAECRRRSSERRVAEDMERELRAGSPQAATFWEALELKELPRIVDILRLIHEMGGVSPSTSFDGVLEGDVSGLMGRSDALLQLLVRLGCLEVRGDALCVERRVAEALPG